MRIATFDIETSTFGFKANSGFILCCGIKELGKPVRVLVRDNMQPDPLNDKKLVLQIYEELSKMDMVVGHNIKWFDIPFINSRLARARHPFLPPIPFFDTCDVAYKKLKLKNSLEALGEYLGCKTSKFKVSFDDWVRAYSGNKKSLKRIVRHCINDVKLNEEVYLRLRPLGFKHPNVALINEDGRQCPVCGKRNTLQSRGFLPAKVNRAKRYQCVPSKGGCGTWSHARYEKVKGIEVRI